MGDADEVTRGGGACGTGGVRSTYRDKHRQWITVGARILDGAFR